MSKIRASVTFALLLGCASLLGCAKNADTAPSTASAAARGACVLTCEGAQQACVDDVAEADCKDPAKKSTIFTALPRCPHEVKFQAGKCPK